jgi:regulatory protein
VGDVLDERAAASSEYVDAMGQAGRLLARGPKTEHRLRQRLEAAGISTEVIEQVLTRLRALGLVDDLAFARRWIEERSLRVGRGTQALVAELEGRGVDRDTAEQAIAEAGLDETASAREWASRLMGRVLDRPLADQATQLRVLLLRRGFSEEAASEGARAVLPPDGWD